jgi:hypothetical protein
LLQQKTGTTLTTTARESACSCECMHDMAIMMQCNLSNFKWNRNPNTHIYGSSCFTTWQFKSWLAWQRQDMGELCNIKWSGENIISISQVLHILLIRWDANNHITTWCKMQTVKRMA